MTTLDYMLGGLVLLLLAAVSPLIYEQATSEPPCADAAYWSEHGYPPLDASSTGAETSADEAVGYDAAWEGGVR